MKIKAIPFIIRKLYQMGDSVNFDNLEREFEVEFKSVSVATTRKKQRPFWRTINFIRDDLGLIGKDNLLISEKNDLENDEEIMETIYEHAYENLVPFNLLYNTFKDFGTGKRSWGDYRRVLSAQMKDKAKVEHPKAYADRDKKAEWGILYWEIADVSLNRLVELFRILGIGSFVVDKHIRYIGPFEKTNEIKTIDFDDLIELLVANISDFGPEKIISIDEIFDVVSVKGVIFGAMEDALLSNWSKIQPFSSKGKEEKCIKHNNNEYYTIRFNKKAMGE